MCCRVHGFFCGCTLRQGAITTAVVTGILALICIIVGAVSLIGASAIKQSTIYPSGYHPDEKTVNAGVTMLNVIGGFILTLGLLAVIGCGCMIGAVVKNSPGLVIPWLIIGMIHIVIDCLVGILSLFALSYSGVLWLVPAGFLIYFWIVCYSYKAELEEGPPYPATTIKA